MSLQEEMDRIYRDVPIAKIPWCVGQLPRALLDLIESGEVQPCKAVDLGCGAGLHTVGLAKLGFEMTGVDLSSRAIQLAEEHARAEGVTCSYLVADLIRAAEALDGEFDFAFEWEVMHHVFPEDRSTYLANVTRLLRPGGRYMSVSFSENSQQFGGHGKYRETPLGTVLYHSSEEELRQAYEGMFEVLELSTVEVPGKYGPHLAVLALLLRP